MNPVRWLQYSTPYLTARFLTMSYFISGILLKVAEVTYLLWDNVNPNVVVGVATGLWAGGSGVWIPAEKVYFILSITFVPSLGSRGPLLNEYRGSFSMIKRPDREVTTQTPYNDEVKNQWSITSSPSVCVNGVDGDNFTHYLYLSGGTCVLPNAVWVDEGWTVVICPTVP